MELSEEGLKSLVKKGVFFGLLIYLTIKVAISLERLENKGATYIQSYPQAIVSFLDFLPI